MMMDTKSKRILSTCGAGLIHLMTEVDRDWPVQILHGFRTAQEQFELYKIGRKLTNGVWTIIGKTVTNCDGYEVLSNHQSYPSEAVDVAFTPIDWDDMDKWREFTGFIYGVAARLKIKVRNLGQSYGDWPHWEMASKK
jgi:hypothetical protein